MSRIKDGPLQGTPIPSTAPEQAEAADRISQSGTRVATPQQNAERQAQAGLAEALLRQKKTQTAADAERLVSQAGYQRAGGKKRDKSFDVGDSTQAPIPLPADDTEASEWSQSALQDAQEGLTQQGAAFFEAAKTLPQGADLEALWQEVVSQRYGEDPEALSKLADAAQHGTSEPQAASLQLSAMQHNAEALFGISLGKTAPGDALVAAALMVAGAAEAVHLVAKPSGAAHTLEPRKLAAGVQNVVKGGHAAVEDARAMNQGIDKNLSMHRTFVFKR